MGKFKKNKFRRQAGSDSDDEVAKMRPKNTIEETAIRINRLFRKNSDKVIELPEKPKKREVSPPPEFVRSLHGKEITCD